MSFIEENCKALIESLSQTASSFQGPSAVALTGAIGSAFGLSVGQMVSQTAAELNLQNDSTICSRELETLQSEFADLMDRYAQTLIPLKQAYALNAHTDEEKIHKT